jgi:hypothetical protein
MSRTARPHRHRRRHTLWEGVLNSTVKWSADEIDPLACGVGVTVEAGYRPRANGLWTAACRW